MGSAQDFRHDRLSSGAGGTTTFGTGLGAASDLRSGYDRTRAASTDPDLNRPVDVGPLYETTADRTTSPDHASSDEIRRDIDRTRSEMDRTLNALGERLDPRSMMDEGWDLVRSLIGGTGAGDIDYRDTAKRVGASAAVAVRENPVPALLGGAALAWMLFEDPVRRQLRRRKYESVMNLPEYSGSVVDARTGKPYDVESYGAEYKQGGACASSGPGLMERAKDAAAGVKDAVAGAAGSVKGAVSGAVGAVSGAASGVGSAASHAAGAVSSAGQRVGGSTASAGHRVAETAGRVSGAVSGSARSAAHAVGGASHVVGERIVGATHRTADLSRTTGRAVGRSAQTGYAFSRERYDRAMDQSPLLVGLGCLAAGLLAGFVAPRTRVEDEFIGEQSDEIKHTVRDRARETFDQGKEKAAEVAVQVLDKAERKGLTPATLVEKATSAVQKAAVSVQKTVQDKAESAQETAGRKIDSLASSGSKTPVFRSSEGDSPAERTGSFGSAGYPTEPELSANLGSAMSATGTTSAAATADFGDEMAGEGKFAGGGTSAAAGASAVKSDLGLAGETKKKGGSCGC